MASSAAANERKCTDCGSTQFVVDHAQGDLVCGNCGLVAEAHLIDERSEWRTFSDKDKEGEDPNRVGGPGNPLLDGGGLTTMIGQGRDGDGAHALNRMHMRNNNPERALNNAFRELEKLCDQVGITSKPTWFTACELYKKAHVANKLRGRSMHAMCAACLFQACAMHKTPRSFKHITEVMPAQVQKKDIFRCFREIMDLLQAEMRAGTAAPTQTAGFSHPAQYMKQFCVDLMLPFKFRTLCEDVAQNAKPESNSPSYPWDARLPATVAAAILFLVTELKREPGKDWVSMQDLTRFTGVAEGTIRAVYRDMHPLIRQLLPAGTYTEAELAQLPLP